MEYSSDHFNYKEKCTNDIYEKQPVYFVRPFKETRSTWMWLQMIGKELRWLGRQNEAQKLFSLIAINIAGTIILLIWCRLTSSLALLAYTYLSLFNFLSLVTWLLCIWVEGQAASMSFTFGLIRCEVLAVFTSVTLTLIGSLFIMKESVERFIQPEQIHLDHLSCMAFVGFILNIVMTMLIKNPPLSHVLRCSSSSLLQEHFSDMCHSLCFHLPGLRRLLLPRLNPLILISLVGLIFIIGNHVVVQVYNYTRCDTIVAFLIALLIMSTMYPLSLCSAHLLLQTIPLHYSAHLDKCLREALTLDGVLEFHNERFWVLGIGHGSNSVDTKFGRLPAPVGDWSGSIVAGSLHVRIRRDANEQMVLKHIKDRLKPLVPLLTVQVFKDDWTRSTTTLRLLNDCVTSPIGEPKMIPSSIGATSSLSHSFPYQNYVGKAGLPHPNSIYDIYTQESLNQQYKFNPLISQTYPYVANSNGIPKSSNVIRHSHHHDSISCSEHPRRSNTLETKIKIASSDNSFNTNEENL